MPRRARVPARRPDRVRPAWSLNSGGRTSEREHEIDSREHRPYKPRTLGPPVRRSFCCAPGRPVNAPALDRDRMKKGRTPRYQTNEAYLSALQARPQAAPRLSRPHGHQRRPRSSRRPPRPRPQAALRLTGIPGAGELTSKPTGKTPGRLRKRAEYLAVRGGEKRRGRLFLLEVLHRGDDLPPRFGVTVTKKTGNAVTRNRIRRRLKEAVRVHAADDMAAGSDYVIVGRRDVLDAPFDELKTELSRRMRGSRSSGSRPGGSRQEIIDGK